MSALAYKHIFFDLDKTLWDIDRNSHETLLELSAKHDITGRGVTSVPEFITTYKKINDQLWLDYTNNKIEKEALRFDRFRLAFGVYGIVDTALAEAFGNDYISTAPLKNNLLPNTIETLDYLSQHYQLHIITNGFEEVQFVKLNNCNLSTYFKHIITSERAGYKKPDSRIFEFSMTLAGATKESSIMIGDSLEADIIGARNAGIAQVYFNPGKVAHTEQVTHEIGDLKELLELL